MQTQTPANIIDYVESVFEADEGVLKYFYKNGKVANLTILDWLAKALMLLIQS